MKTYKVLDMTMTQEEGQDCFDGTQQECLDFISKQPDGNIGYEVVPMTEEEIKSHPDNKSVKVVDRIGLTSINKSKKPRFVVVGVDKAIGSDKAVTNFFVKDKIKNFEKPKFVVKKKAQELPKEEIKVIYSREQSVFGDPLPEEVNYAFHVIKNMEKTEKGLKFLYHIAINWNPLTLNHLLKVLDDGMICCITGKPIAGIMPLSKKLVEVTPISFTIKEHLQELTQEDVDERNKAFFEMPEEYRIQRIGFSSFNSDKTLSIAGFYALKYYLLEDGERLLKFEVGKQSAINNFTENFGQPKETNEQYSERKRMEKQGRPDMKSFGLEGDNLSKLQKLMEAMEDGTK